MFSEEARDQAPFLPATRFQISPTKHGKFILRMLWVPPPQIVPPPRNLWHGKNNHQRVSDQPRPHRAIINSCSFLNWIAAAKQIIKGNSKYNGVQEHVLFQKVSGHRQTMQGQ